jgi:hypothetical protein
MVELGPLLHEISVAFGCSTNLRTLPARLADGMGRHLPVVEVETMRLLEDRGEVRISAFAPGLGRWEGQRSRRFFEQQRVVAPAFVSDELARVAIAPVACKLKLPVGRAGLLAVAFETDISVSLGGEVTEMLVDVLACQCLRLGQLTATAARSRRAHRRRTNHEISVPASKAPKTEISLSKPERKDTEIQVEPVDAALVRCISTALHQTQGRIYGSRGAAALLGLKPSTLQSKMRKLGIERAAFTPDSSR